jgi:N utilization substance protein B
MSLRHKARVCALQMLFQWDVGGQDPRTIEGGFWQMTRAEKSTREFANALFEGAAAGAPQLDQLLADHAKNWRVERFSSIDRAILRLAVHELRAGQTPPKVVLNEAVELAKTYSTEEAASFVNGVLDAVQHSLAAKAVGG